MSGQRVLVTAGASGIGLAIMHAFVDAGARVHIADIDEAAVTAAVATSPAVSGTVCDVSDSLGVDQIFADVEAHLNGPW